MRAIAISERTKILNAGSFHPLIHINEGDFININNALEVGSSFDEVSELPPAIKKSSAPIV